jgi:hypothetical protein
MACVTRGGGEDALLTALPEGLSTVPVTDLQHWHGHWPMAAERPQVGRCNL